MVLSKSACDSPGNSPTNHKIFLMRCDLSWALRKYMNFAGLRTVILLFYSESPNRVSALFLRVGSPVLDDSNDPDEKYGSRAKVVIFGAIIRRKQALPAGG